MPNRPPTTRGKAFEILSDFVLNSVFPEDEMEREKGVVLEEIAMTEDTPTTSASMFWQKRISAKRGTADRSLGPPKT